MITYFQMTLYKPCELCHVKESYMHSEPNVGRNSLTWHQHRQICLLQFLTSHKTQSFSIMFMGLGDFNPSHIIIFYDSADWMNARAILCVYIMYMYMPYVHCTPEWIHFRFDVNPKIEWVRITFRLISSANCRAITRSFVPWSNQFQYGVYTYTLNTIVKSSWPARAMAR